MNKLTWIKSLFKPRIIIGFKITAVSGKKEIILWEQYLPNFNKKIKIPAGYDLLLEVIELEPLHE